MFGVLVDVADQGRGVGGEDGHVEGHAEFEGESESEGGGVGVGDSGGLPGVGPDVEDERVDARVVCQADIGFPGLDGRALYRSQYQRIGKGLKGGRTYAFPTM